MIRLTIVPITILSLVLTALSAMGNSNVDPVGTWNIEIAAPDGSTKKRVATFTKQEDALKGSLYNPDRDMNLDLVVERDGSENKIRFTIKFDGSSVAYAGNIDGDSMSGIVYYDINGRKFDTSFSATRKVKN